MRTTCTKIIQGWCQINEIWIWSISEMITRENQRTQERNLSHCHFIHKSHMDWPGIKHGPPWWEVSDQTHEPRQHLIHIVLTYYSNADSCKTYVLLKCLLFTLSTYRNKHARSGNQLSHTIYKLLTFHTSVHSIYIINV
jgi:hypothetical protein